MLSVHGKTNVDDEIPITVSKNIDTQTKSLGDKNDQDLPNMESMTRIIKNFSNDVVDLKKMASENTTKAFLKHPFKRMVTLQKVRPLQPLKRLTWVN